MAEEPRPPGSFPTTRWSLVRRAQDADPDVRRQALEELLRRYYRPLLAHLVVRMRLEPSVAEDLLQSFIAQKVLEQHLVDEAAAAKGRFRSLLLQVLKNYYVDVQRRRHAAKRSPERALSLDEEAQQPHAVASGSPDVFDVSWAREVLSQALARMRDHCRQRHQPQTWGLFECRILIPALQGTAPMPYEQVVRRFGFASPEQASNALMTAKRQFKRSVEEVVADYAGTAEEVEEEIADLRKILASAGPLELGAAHDAAGPMPGMDDSSSRDLAPILQMSASRDVLWAPGDLSDIWAHELSQPLAELVPAAALLRATRSEAGSANQPPPQTLADLLHHPRPPITLLQSLKRLARGRVRDRASPVPSEISSGLYFAVIAAALVHHGQHLSKSPDEVLRRAFQGLLPKPWLDDATRSLVRQGLERLHRPDLHPPSGSR
jgi:DNA-directed RNA polymerase specialized sigma24 family protein